jgi:hypothetical protein
METTTYTLKVMDEKGYTWAELSDDARQNAIDEELERRADEDFEGFMTKDEIADYLSRESVVSAITGGWNYFHGDDRDRWTADGEYLG